MGRWGGGVTRSIWRWLPTAHFHLCLGSKTLYEHTTFFPVKHFQRGLYLNTTVWWQPSKVAYYLYLWFSPCPTRISTAFTAITTAWPGRFHYRLWLLIVLILKPTYRNVVNIRELFGEGCSEGSILLPSQLLAVIVAFQPEAWLFPRVFRQQENTAFH